MLDILNRLLGLSGGLDPIVPTPKRGHQIGPGHRSMALNRYARRTASLGPSRQEITSYFRNRKTGEVLPRTRIVTSVVWP